MATRKSGPWYEDEQHSYYDEEKSWLAKYYPVQADQVRKRNALDSELALWIGHRKSSIKKAKLDAPPLDWGPEISPLCWSYRRDAGVFDDSSHETCGKCPLRTAREGLRCDSNQYGHNTDTPFYQYIQHDDPEPMIRLIRKAIKARDAKKAAKK